MIELDLVVGSNRINVTKTFHILMKIVRTGAQNAENVLELMYKLLIQDCLSCQQLLDICDKENFIKKLLEIVRCPNETLWPASLRCLNVFYQKSVTILS